MHPAPAPVLQVSGAGRGVRVCVGELCEEWKRGKVKGRAGEPQRMSEGLSLREESKLKEQLMVHQAVTESSVGFGVKTREQGHKQGQRQEHDGRCLC